MDGHTLHYTVYALDAELNVIHDVETSLVIDGFVGSAVVNDLPAADFYAICEIVPVGIEAVYIAGLPSGERFDDDELGACIVFDGDEALDGGLIEAYFFNDVEDEKPPVKPEKPVKPTTPHKPGKVVVVTTTTTTAGGATVTTLPSTGSGEEAGTNNVASLTLLAGATLLAGTGLLLRKERHAA